MKNITTVFVRDKIVDCFTNAHCNDTELGQADFNTSHKYCMAIVKKKFKECGGDFDNPTKDDLMRVVKGLADFAKLFRNQKIINKNTQKIIALINKI